MATNLKLSGQITVTTAGTAVQGDDVPGKIFALKAAAANTGIAYVGNDGAGDVASTNGFPLETTSGMVTIAVDNLNRLWFDVQTGGEKVAWLRTE